MGRPIDPPPKESRWDLPKRGRNGPGSLGYTLGGVQSFLPQKLNRSKSHSQDQWFLARSADDPVSV